MGIDVRDANGPVHTGVSVVAGLNASRVQLLPTERELVEVITTQSARHAAYCRNGWTRRTFSAGMWSLRASGESRTESSSSHSQSESSLKITGRYVHPRCQLTIRGDLGPSGDLKKAIDRALALADESQQKAELIKVFDNFGHVYASSVEMGGMKHILTSRKVAEKV